jgi:NADPH:quinone reductase-like Zn-dependent oxidoreductase
MGGKLISEFDLGALIAKRGQLLCTTLKTRSIEYKAKLLKDLNQCFFESGHEFNPILHTVLPMSAAAAAHELMESNETIGKILLKYDL